ncbi:MAG TPA: DEAD/DEAH box helicase, partial [Limnochordia bacterium]|nr:DEAD/DEAH box helicase [Limnochordia bacterium]
MPDSPLRVSLPIMQIDLNNPFGAALAESWREVPHDGAFDLRLSASARDELLEITRTQDYASPHWHRLALAALSWRQRVGSGDLQVLQHLRERFKHAGVVLYPHQIETVRKVIDEMDGRAILADEVGLGKTIEAGMILKEYILRGRVDKALILVPAALQWQWYSELKEKFGILAAILRTEHDWERCSVIIASIDAAKRALHKPYLERIAFDLLIVDEAHRLKNRKTRNWSFVNDLHKKYFLMLTATPIQNDLQELHNLIALLKPDQLGTKQSFKREFVFDKHTPKRTEQLRERLSAVLIRN